MTSANHFSIFALIVSRRAFANHPPPLFSFFSSPPHSSYSLSSSAVAPAMTSLDGPYFRLIFIVLRNLTYRTRDLQYSTLLQTCATSRGGTATCRTTRHGKELIPYSRITVLDGLQYHAIIQQSRIVTMLPYPSLQYPTVSYRIPVVSSSNRAISSCEPRLPAPPPRSFSPLAITAVCRSMLH